MLHQPVLLAYKKIQMAASRDQVQLTASLNVKHDDGSCLDIFKKRKYYFKLYLDRLEAFPSIESSIGSPKFTIYPGKDTVIEQLKSPPCSIKIHSKDAKIIIETKSAETQSLWLQQLTEVFKENAKSQPGYPSESAHGKIVECNRGTSTSNCNVKVSKEIFEHYIRKNSKDANTCKPKTLTAAVAKSNFVPVPLLHKVIPSKIGKSAETSKPNALQQSNSNTANFKLAEGNNNAQSSFPSDSKMLLITSNGKGPPIESSHSVSPPMSSLPPIKKPLITRPIIVPSDDQYDGPEDYDSIEEQPFTSPNQIVQEKSRLEVIPVNLSRVLYGRHKWPFILRFKDGKISLLKKETDELIVNWEFKHIRKFKCKADLFYFETGHKYPGGAQLFEFQLVENASQKSINEIYVMIYQEMKQVGENGSKKIKNQVSKENLIGKNVSPVDIRRSYFNPNDGKLTPLVPPPFTSKPKTEVKRTDVVIIQSDEFYDELVDYDGLEEDETTDQLTQPLLPVTQPLNDGIKKKDSSNYGYMWEQSTPSSQHQPPEVRESPVTLKNNPERGTTPMLENPSDPRRYKGPIDDSLYALPSQC